MPDQTTQSSVDTKIPNLFDLNEDSLTPETKNQYVAIGEEICDCAGSGVTVIKEVDKFKQIRQFYNFFSIHYVPTEESLVGKPKLFFERIEEIQNLVFDDSDRPSYERNASTIKKVIELAGEISSVEKQKKAVNSKTNGINDPDSFIDAKKNEVIKLVGQRKNLYKGNFGFGKLIELQVITEEQFEQIFEADIINLNHLLGSNEDYYTLDQNKIDRYFADIDEYVIMRETTRKA